MAATASPKPIGAPSMRDDVAMPELSVIICSHNPRPLYLRRVLIALQAQALPKQQWELLLIDNLSSEPLTTNWDLTWHPNARRVFEGELGLSAARRRGIRESSAAIIVFVDDDNVLDEHYLSTVLCIGRQWPILGTWGSGATTPEFEVRPSEAVKALLPYLALRDTHIAQWGNVAWETIPNGAGLCVRRKIAEEYCRLSEDSDNRS